MYYRLIKYVDRLWKESLAQSGSVGDYLVPAAAEEYVASQVSCVFCGTKPGKTDEPLRSVHAGMNACSSAPVETQNQAIENVPEHYTALLGAFPSSEEFQASISEPESESDLIPDKE
jgi:hypothetical protein